MGRFDSSKTRVGPVFTRLLLRDPSGAWLERLLRLPTRFDGVAPEIPKVGGPLRRCGWHPEEVRLPAPSGLLRALVENVVPQRSASVGERRLLLEGDAEARTRALDLLARRDPMSMQRAWYVLEGPTSVDAYLETHGVIVLIEGKRTERGPTTNTSWMKVRHQILRNIDAAWDHRAERAVVSFFIVDGGGLDRVSESWQEATRLTVSDPVLDASLPHRTPRERRAIAAAFLGVTTWQSVCREFGIDVLSLPEEVSERYPPRRRPGV